MDAIKTIADGIRAERKEALEQKKPASKDDVVAAVSPEAAKKTEEPKTEPKAEPPAEGDTAGPEEPADDNKE